jgi:NAD(P)H-nitrite reductase large subunit
MVSTQQKNITKKYIIIGVSASGVACASKLRELDKESEIIMIGADAKLPCNRCLLSEILSGDKTEKEITTKDLDYFEKQNIKVMLNTLVIDVLPSEKAVALFDGQKLHYDKLFLGVGKSGFVPDIPGSKFNGVFSFYGLPEVTAICDFINKNKVNKVVMVGAGLTGLECADALLSNGLNVDIVERSVHVLPYQIDQQGAGFIQNLMKERKIGFYPGQVIEKIIGVNGKVSGIVLSDQGEIPADMVIFAIGGKTNMQLPLRAGIDTLPHGVVTSSTMQTSNPDIFAGGDCCMVNDLLTGQAVQSCLWPDAVMQGIVAAHGMAGFKREYPGTIIVTSSNVFGIPFVTCGPVNQINPNFEEIIDQGSDFFHKFLVSDGELKSFVMVGKVDNVGLLRKQLIDKTPFRLQTIKS